MSEDSLLNSLTMSLLVVSTCALSEEEHPFIQLTVR